MKVKVIARTIMAASLLFADAILWAQSQAQPEKAAVSQAQPAAPQEAVKAREEVPGPALEEDGPPVEGGTGMPEDALLEPGNVTVNFKGADIRTVLSYISEVAGIDIVPAPDVKGPIDVKLTNKPWKVALDIIVRNYGFAYEREGDIIRVDTIDKLKQQELITRSFDLNYANAKQMGIVMKDLVSDRGKIVSDDRTNTVLVTDVPTSIYNISQVMERLDAKTSQVLIEARIIETVLDKNEKMGIDWSTKITATGARRPWTAPFDYFGWDAKGLDKYIPLSQTNVSTPIGLDPVTGIPLMADPAKYPTNSQQGSKSFPFISIDDYKDLFTFGTLDFTQFSAVLEMLKNRANTEVISNPRVATLNNKEASIMVGTTLGLPKYERNSTTGKMEITGYESKDLGIKLKVTPQINTKEEIVVDLKPEISDLLRYDVLDAGSGIRAPVFSTREARTQIMVKNGDTIFIGGLIQETDKVYTSKLPILGDVFGDVPYLGLLFSKKEKSRQKTELIFFITVNLIGPERVVANIPSSAKAYLPRYSLYEKRSGDWDSKKQRE